MAEPLPLDQQPMPKLRIRGLKKTFGDQMVLNGLDLDIQAGNHLVLLGVSGSGKTVLLKCILGLIGADSGSIMIDGENVINRPPVDNEQLMQRIGVLFQNGALFDSLTVWENISFSIRGRQDLDDEEARAIAQQKLRAVGLGPDVADLYPAEISGGMQKRVAFARAIVSSTEILLLDSPTAGLDPILTTIINGLMKTTIDELHGTALTITQDVSSALQIADRIALLHEGSIVWEGPAADTGHSGNPHVDAYIANTKDPAPA